MTRRISVKRGLVPLGVVALVAATTAVTAKRPSSSSAVALDASVAHSSPYHASGAVQNYLYTPSVDLTTLASQIKRPDIQGVQVLYRWRQLEPREGHYDFSQIAKDLKYLDSLHKKLFIQIQDRSFTATPVGIPAYLLANPVFRGGAAPQYDNTGKNIIGWVAQQWVPAVHDRFEALLSALAHSFDDRVAGVNLPETSITIDETSAQAQSGYTCDSYFKAVIGTMRHARSVFRHSSVVQYVNFWCGLDSESEAHLAQTFQVAEKNGIGLGGPDVTPWKPYPMRASAYPFFNKNKGKLSLVAMAVQEPDLQYVDPNTGKLCTRQDFAKFATNYLGANVIFWATSSPWLHQS